MRTKASFILLSCLLAATLANPLINFPLDKEDIFEPLIHSDTDEGAEQSYRLRLRDIYDYELEATNKPHAILSELGRLRPDQIKHRFVQDDPEYVLGVIKQAFITLKHKMTDEKAIADAFTLLARNYNARKLQQALKGVEELEGKKKKDKGASISSINETVDPIVNADVIAQAFDSFLKKNSIKDTKPEGVSGYVNLGVNDLDKVDRDFVLAAANKAFAAKIEEGRKQSKTILVFRQAPLEQAVETFDAVMGYLLHHKLKPEHTAHLARRVLNFIHLADMVTNANAASKYIAQLGELITRQGFAQMSNNLDFVRELISKVLKTAAFSSNIEETIQRVSQELLRHDLVRTGTPIVIVSDILSDHFGANSILLHHA